MRYTTVIWQPVLTPEQTALLDEKIAYLNANGAGSVLTMVDEGTRQIAHRNWNTLLEAEEWCAFVLNTVGAASAGIDPE